MQTDSTAPTNSVSTTEKSAIARGVLAGAIPLFALIVVILLAIVVAALARALAAPAGFFIWRRIAEGAIMLGLVVAAMVYGVATVRALRQAAAWQRAGLTRQSAGVYWTLFVVAVVTLAPLILALTLPQHPTL